MRKLILTAVAVSLMFGGALMPQAKAAPRNCNPAPDPYHVIQMAKANGAVFVEVGYGWDGISVYPNCVGPIVGARVTNNDTKPWYAWFPKARGGFRTVTLPAGEARTYSAAQLAAVGLVTLEDISAVTLRDTPAP
jgi:hypothetical protein